MAELKKCQKCGCPLADLNRERQFCINCEMAETKQDIKQHLFETFDVLDINEMLRNADDIVSEIDKKNK